PEVTGLDVKHLPFRQLITCSAEAVIPALDESAQTFAQVNAGKIFGCAGDLSPSVHARPAIGKGIEHDPLFHCVSHKMINPGDLLRGIANCDGMVNHGLNRPDDFYA